MNILCVSRDKYSGNFIGLLGESSRSGELVEVSSGVSALEVLKDRTIDLVFFDDRIVDIGIGYFHSEAKKLIANDRIIYLVKSKSESPEVQSFVKSEKEILLLEKPYCLEGFVKTVSPFFEVDFLNDEYIPIYLKRVERTNSFRFDYFVKFKDGRFVKVLSKGQSPSHVKLSIFKGDTSKLILYVKREDYKSILDNLLLKLSMILKSPELNLESKLQAKIDIHKTVVDKVRSFGIDMPVIEACDDVFHASVSSLKKTPLKNLLDVLMSREGSYLYQHSIMLVYLTGAMVLESDLPFKETAKKLTYSAFFHDAFLSKELAEDRDNVDQKAIEKDKDHPERAYQILKKMNFIPEDVCTIIRQHHEKVDGSGFPRGIGVSLLTRLSLIFIVAEDFISETYDVDVKNKNLLDLILRKMRDRYELGQSKKVFEYLEKALGQSL